MFAIISILSLILFLILYTATSATLKNPPSVYLFAIVKTGGVEKKLLPHIMFTLLFFFWKFKIEIERQKLKSHWSVVTLLVMC